MVESGFIIQAYQSLLGRLPTPEEITSHAALPDLATALARLIETDEYQGIHAEGRHDGRPRALDFGCRAGQQARPRPDPYLAPDELEVTDAGPRKILLIGACFLFSWPERLAEAGVHVPIDRLLFAHSIQLPKTLPAPAEDYDLQIVQVPLPSIIPDLDQMRIGYDDIGAYEALFEQALQRLDLFLEEAMAWSDQIPAYILNYVTPQQNLLGRLLPRYDIRNPIHFVERINMALEQAVSRFRNARVNVGFGHAR